MVGPLETFFKRHSGWIHLQHMRIAVALARVNLVVPKTRGRGAGCGVRGAGCGVRGAGCGVRGAGSLLKMKIKKNNK